jgi:transposase InsO family protein
LNFAVSDTVCDFSQRLNPCPTAASTLDFLEQVVEEMLFPIQRIQTDRGQEFLACKVQKCLLNWAIRFRPIKPRSPHLNGKVERSQNLDEKLAEWKQSYNWYRRLRP